MKNVLNTTKALAAFALLLISSGAFAQTNDTTNFVLGDKTILVIDTSVDDTTGVDSLDLEDPSDDKYTLTHWGGIDLGVNLLLNNSGGTTMDSANQWLDLDYSRSLSWRFNIIEEKIRFYKDYVGLIVGAGITYNSYGLKNNVVVMTSDSLGTYAMKDTVNDYSKNKFRASYINVPLILEFNTSEDNDKCFHIGVGAIGGWNMGAITRQKWMSGDDKNNLRTKGDYNVNPFTLEATARIGYKDFTLFATYGLTPLFEKNKGPEVFPVTVGLQVVPF